MQSVGGGCVRQDRLMHFTVLGKKPCFRNAVWFIYLYINSYINKLTVTMLANQPNGFIAAIKQLFQTVN